MARFDPFENQGGAAAFDEPGADDAARLAELLGRVESIPSLEPDDLPGASAVDTDALPFGDDH